MTKLDESKIKLIDSINHNPGTRIICEWCGKIIIGRRKRFCNQKSCMNPYFTSNKSSTTRKKLSDSNMGHEVTEETRDKIRKGRSGKTCTLSDETRKKMSIARKGEGNPQYGKTGELSPNYGISRSPEVCNQIAESNRQAYQNYEYDSDASQSKYRRAAIETYGYVCSGCGKDCQNLDVHHINGDHSDNRIENLVVLCRSCHGKVHPNRFRGDSTPDEEFTKYIIESRDRRLLNEEASN